MNTTKQSGFQLSDDLVSEKPVTNGLRGGEDGLMQEVSNWRKALADAWLAPEPKAEIESLEDLE